MYINYQLALHIIIRRKTTDMCIEFVASTSIMMMYHLFTPNGYFISTFSYSIEWVNNRANAVHRFSSVISQDRIFVIERSCASSRHLYKAAGFQGAVGTGAYLCLVWTGLFLV